MSALPNMPQPMTEAEYLALERASESKHEYIAGEIVAMVGASERHNLIVGSTLVAIYMQLRGKPCKIYPSDMRVKIEAFQQYTYPDLSILCGDAQFTDDALDTILNPVVLIEVLSPSTERYDRGKKFQAYRAIPSLRDVVLIAQDSPIVECYHRGDDGKWTLTDARGLDASVSLRSVGCDLALKAVYEQVTFDKA